MANLTTYKNNIISQLLDTLENLIAVPAADGKPAQHYQCTEFYGTASPESLINYIKGRLNTGVGSIFVRINRIERTAIDTIGQMYEAKVICDIMVATQTAAREDQQHRAERLTDQMLVQVSDALVESPVELDDRPYYIFLGNEQEMFRDAEAGGMDVQILNAEIDGLVIEY